MGDERPTDAMRSPPLFNPPRNQPIKQPVDGSATADNKNPPVGSKGSTSLGRARFPAPPCLASRAAAASCFALSWRLPMVSLKSTKPTKHRPTSQYTPPPPPQTTRPCPAVRPSVGRQCNSLRRVLRRAGGNVRAEVVGGGRAVPALGARGLVHVHGLDYSGWVGVGMSDTIRGPAQIDQSINQSIDR